MMIKIIQCNDMDDSKLMSIYAEGNFENTDYFYPEITDKAEAVKKVEHDFCEYIKTKFLNGTNIYYVWENDGIWVSALRLYYIKDNFYYLEALETAPDFRRKGYAAQLITAVINELKLNGHFKICSCVRKNNIASLNTHKKCGFNIVSENGYDYLQKEINVRNYGMEYSF